MMKLSKQLLGLMFCSTAAFYSPGALASNYPPGYSVEQSCQTKGPVEICANNQHYGGYPRLKISYNGVLNSPKVKVWIQLNGRTGTFPLMDKAVYINHPQAYMCIVGGPAPDTESRYSACLYDTHSEHEGAVVWEVKPIPAREAELFFYARNQFGIANAWDIELAFVDDTGQWDNANGRNFRFRFL